MLVAITHNAVSPEARPDERDVLAQVDAVKEALDELRHEYVVLPVTLDLDLVLSHLKKVGPDVVFNLIESLGPSDQLATLAIAELEQAGLSVTGSTSVALWLTNHKTLAKQELANAELPTPAWYEPQQAHALRKGEHQAIAELVSPFLSKLGDLPVGTRYIIKLLCEHASLGMDESAIVAPQSWEELAALVEQRSRKLARPCFAEQFIDGREFNVALLVADDSCEVLPLAEIDFSAFPAGMQRIVDYQAKWDDSSFAYHHTPAKFRDAATEPELHAELGRLAQRCWTIFQLGGYARVDFRIDQDGRPWILEINTNPCLSPDAGFQSALQQAGISFPQGIQRILLAARPRC